MIKEIILSNEFNTLLRSGKNRFEGTKSKMMEEMNSKKGHGRPNKKQLQS